MPKILLVTGASSELGTATIQAVAENYRYVIAHYHHMNKRLEQLQEELGGRLVCVQADLSDDQSTEALIAKIKESGYVPTEIVHFPAPPIITRKFHKTSWDVFQNSLDISVRSIVKILSAFLPGMSKEKCGKVVVMLSMAVNHMPPKYNSDYVLTKYALLGLVRSLAVEYADKGITVNGISPALVETRFVEGLHDFLIEENARQSPAGRNLKVEDVVPTIAFLLSDEAGCINGQNISITCGR